MASPASEAASSVHGGVESREPSATAADQAPRPPRSTQEHNKIGSEWLGPETCSGHGPLEGAAAAQDSVTGSESCAMDCSPNTPEEEALLSKLGPKPKQRRRRAILRSYDQLVELSEANAQRKHDARYGPTQGAEQVCPLSAPAVPECLADTQEADPALDLHAMD